MGIIKLILEKTLGTNLGIFFMEENIASSDDAINRYIEQFKSDGTYIGSKFLDNNFLELKKIIEHVENLGYIHRGEEAKNLHTGGEDITLDWGSEEEAPNNITSIKANNKFIEIDNRHDFNDSRVYGKFKNIQNVPYYEKLKQKATMSESQYRDSMILEACQQKRLHTYVDYNFEVGNIRYDHGCTTLLVNIWQTMHLISHSVF